MNERFASIWNKSTIDQRLRFLITSSGSQLLAAIRKESQRTCDASVAESHRTGYLSDSQLSNIRAILPAVMLAILTETGLEMPYPDFSREGGSGRFFWRAGKRLTLTLQVISADTAEFHYHNAEANRSWHDEFKVGNPISLEMHGFLRIMESIYLYAVAAITM